MKRPPKYRFEQFFATKSLVPTVDFAPDGRSVAFVANDTGYFNLYRQGLSEREPLQLTDSKQLKPKCVRWAPDGYIYFLADTDGNEQANLYRIPAAGGALANLTNRPDAQYISLRLSRDGGALYYTGNPINPLANHLFRRDLATGEERLLGGGPGLWTVGYESPSGRYLTVTQLLSRTNRRIHLWDNQTGELRELTAGLPEAHREAGPWYGDDDGFLYVSDEQGEFAQGHLYALAEGRSFAAITPTGNVEALFGTPDAQRFGFVVNAQGYFKLTVSDLDSGLIWTAPPDLQGGVILDGALSPDGSKVAVILTRPNRPDELFVWEVGTQSITRVTDCLGAQLDPDSLVTPELIAIPGPDHPIPAWLYRPAGLAAGERVPVLISFHGGPEAQELPLWEPLYQYLLDQGIAVLAPNIRGSSGYGKSYQRLIYRDWGGGDLRDMEACAQWAQAQDWIDPDGLVACGGSYGGFAALSCATRLPDYWACVIDFCGPSNLVTLANSLPPSFKPRLKGWLGDPEEEREFLLERSPITYVDQVRCPIMIIQGAQDPRVVQAESDQMVAALRARGVPVEYLLFPDEGHGLDKQSNRLTCWRAMGEFLQKHLP